MIRNTKIDFSQICKETLAIPERNLAAKPKSCESARGEVGFLLVQGLLSLEPFFSASVRLEPEENLLICPVKDLILVVDVFPIVIQALSGV